MSKKSQITLDDIAKKINFSKVTISKALRDHPDIGSATKKLVRETALEMGYTPNFVARNLSAKKSNTIGLVVPKVAHHFFASAIETIYSIAFKNNYEIIMTVSQEDDKREIKHIETLLSMRVDGLLVSVSEKTQERAIFDFVKKKGVPLVFFDRIIPDMGFSWVASDDEQGTFEAINEIIGLGYKKIAHLAGYSYTNIGMDRKNGYQRAMQKNNLLIPHDGIIEGGFGESHGFAGFNKLYETGSLPEVIFAVTYPVALGVLAAAEQVGVNIPDDMDLLCFGGSIYNRFISPSLTYIDQSAAKLAEKAIELLISEINNDDENTVQQIKIPTRLIVCDTCIKCKERMNKY